MVLLGFFVRISYVIIYVTIQIVAVIFSHLLGLYSKPWKDIHISIYVTSLDCLVIVMATFFSYHAVCVGYFI